MNQKFDNWASVKHGTYYNKKCLALKIRGELSFCYCRLRFLPTLSYAGANAA
jgi:hypothetical protein